MINESGETNVVTIKSLSKTYTRQSLPNIEAIHDVTLSISRSEIVCLLGRSGCGKSTLLNIIAGLLEPTFGTVLVFDAVPRAARKHISYIQQNPQLLPYRSVIANAALSLELKGDLDTKSLENVHELLHRLRLDEFSSSYPDELSGGMRQRVALARALAVQAPLILCDEPLASIDFDSRLEIEDFFWREIKVGGRASIFITHNIDSAVALADRIVVLTPRPGSVAAVINVDDELRQEPPLGRREMTSFPLCFSEVWRSLRAAES